MTFLVTFTTTTPPRSFIAENVDTAEQAIDKVRKLTGLTEPATAQECPLHIKKV